MNVLKYALSTSFTAAAVAVSAPSQAALFTEDFESPEIPTQGSVLNLDGVTNGANAWDTNGAQIWRPGTDSSPGRWDNAEPMAAPAGGKQIVFVGANRIATIDTGIEIQADTIYTLSAAVGREENHSVAQNNWSLQLWANNPTIGVDAGEAFIDQSFSELAGVNTPPAGGWAVNSVTWDSASNSALVGSTLSVLLGNYKNSQNVYFDNIEITAVPEPSSLALLGLGGLLVARRRRA